MHKKTESEKIFGILLQLRVTRSMKKKMNWFGEGKGDSLEEMLL